MFWAPDRCGRQRTEHPLPPDVAELLPSEFELSLFFLSGNGDPHTAKKSMAEVAAPAVPNGKFEDRR
jgi:hypothetical protein